MQIQSKQRSHQQLQDLTFFDYSPPFTPGSVNYPKRLIEVNIQIKCISAHARREKSIRQGQTVIPFWGDRIHELLHQNLNRFTE